MSYMCMPRGTLAKMSREKNLVNDMLLLEHKPNGYTEDELTSVRIVTLHEFAHELATREAATWHRSTKDVGMLGDSDEVDIILKGKYDVMREFIQIQDDLEIIIGVNFVTINDEAVTYGLNLLFNMESFEPGAVQHFGESIPLNWR